MNLLRNLALLLAVAAVSLSGKLAYSQQEVDPDHFDQPVVAAQSQKAAPVHHKKAAHATVASKHRPGKHHHGRASA
jgi:hypothetical protein